ncbi:MAG: hypothetical protein Q8M07_08270, partial [Prosthecobacter sp.]|nr:hypothetical protein [Prosthecobacter sp.]
AIIIASMPPLPMHQLVAELAPALSGTMKTASLLNGLVAAEIELAAQRQMHRRSILPLSLEDLDLQLQAGRAGVADLPRPKKISLGKAVQVVTDAFTDGLILLFVNEHRCRGLDEVVTISPDTRVMIVRRTMLTG